MNIDITLSNQAPLCVYYTNNTPVREVVTVARRFHCSSSPYAQCFIHTNLNIMCKILWPVWCNVCATGLELVIQHHHRAATGLVSVDPFWPQQQSPSSETNSHRATQILRLLWNPKFHCRVYKGPPDIPRSCVIFRNRLVFTVSRC
jgi:hypothetical protein